MVGGGGAGVLLAQGALVGWLTPLGTPGPAAPLAHGAAVPMAPPGLADDDVVIMAGVSPTASGSRSAGCGRAVVVVDEDDDFGCEAVWTVAWIFFAFGSGAKEKREPKGKCWTTGNLERTSALYIFIMP
jgi:hypothetical protein